jgi:hypothetical protein
MSTQRDNNGALFKAKPNENPKWPQYEGSAMINGQEYWLSAWLKEGQAGKFFSLAFKPKEAKAEVKPRTVKIDPDEDVPF